MTRKIQLDCGLWLMRRLGTPGGTVRYGSSRFARWPGKLPSHRLLRSLVPRRPTSLPLLADRPAQTLLSTLDTELYIVC
jgi:hypothetical protein